MRIKRCYIAREARDIVRRDEDKGKENPSCLSTRAKLRVGRPGLE